MKQWIVAGLIHFDSIEPMKKHVQKNGFDFNEIVSEKNLYKICKWEHSTKKEGSE